MALKPLLDETPKGPSPEDQLAQERSERARLEQEIRERQAAYEARLDELGRSMQRTAPPVPAPQPTPEAIQAGITPEDIQKDPDKALQMLEDHIRSRAVKDAQGAIEAKYGGLVNSLSQQSVQLELQGLKDKKFFGEAEKDLVRYFEDNPGELQPGRVTEVYNYLVGSNLDRYEDQAKQRAAQDASTSEFRAGANTPTAVEAPMRRSAGPAPEKDKGPEPELSEEEELVRQTYNAHGANISKREWVEISKGKLFPKKRATDWDAGYYKDDRHISRYEG